MSVRRTITESGGVVYVSDLPITYPPTTFTDGDTTPSVLSIDSSRTFIVSNTTPTSITDFDGLATDGWHVYIMVTDDNTTFVHGSGLELPYEEDYVAEAIDILEFFYWDGDWYLV